MAINDYTYDEHGNEIDQEADRRFGWLMAILIGITALLLACAK